MNRGTGSPKQFPSRTRPTSLPAPHVYDLEGRYWPWGRLIDKAASIVSERAPLSAFVVDYMCGTGGLISAIAKQRPDLHVVGCDISLEYVRFARRQRPSLQIRCADALRFDPGRLVDVAICTGGLHHLNDDTQSVFVRRLAEQIMPGGVLLVGEEVLAPFEGAEGRAQMVEQLYDRLHSYLSDVGAPLAMFDTAATVRQADLQQAGEYKQTREALEARLTELFHIEEVVHLWPVDEPQHGDFLFLCRRRDGLSHYGRTKASEQGPDAS